MTDFLANLAQAIGRRQEESRAAAVAANNAAEQVVKVQQAYTPITQDIQRQVIARQAKAQHARELTDSGRFVDRLTVAGLQLTDPGGYNPNIRAKRNAEDAGTLALLGQVKNDSLATIQANLEASRGKLNLAAVTESIALERAQELAKMNEIRFNELHGNVQLQEAALSNMAPNEVEAAIASNKPEVNIGGVTIRQDQLIEHKRRLADVEFARYTQRLNQENSIKDREQEIIDKRVSRERSEILFNQGQEDRPGDKAAQALTREQQIADMEWAKTTRKNWQTEQDKKMLAEANDKILNGMYVPQLQDLQSNGYRDSSGMYYEPAQVDAAIARKTQARADMIRYKLQEEDNKTLPATIVRQYAETVDRLQHTLPSSSALDPHVKAFKVRIAKADALAASGQEEFALNMLETGQKTYEVAAANQAQRDSFGDKNIADLLKDYYTNGTLNMARFAEIAKDRLVRNQSLAPLFPAPQAAAAIQLYNQRKASLVAERTRASGSFGASLTSPELKDIQQQAALDVVTELGNRFGTSLVNEAIVGQIGFGGGLSPDGVTLVPAHPLYGSETREGFAQKEQQARATAYASVAKSYRITADELKTAIETGVTPKGTENFSAAKARAEVNYEANVGVLAQYSTNVQRDIVDWQQKYGGQYINQFLSGYSPSQPGVQSMGLMNMAQEGAQNKWLDYVGINGQASQEIEQRAAQTIQEMHFGEDPVQYQAVLLAANPNLSGPERDMLWKYIAPIAERIARSGITGNDARELIEQNLGTLDLKGPEAKAYKTMMRTRAMDGDTLQGMLKNMLFFKRVPVTRDIALPGGKTRSEIGARLMTGSPDEVITRGAKNLDFYMKWMGGQE